MHHHAGRFVYDDNIAHLRQRPQDLPQRAQLVQVRALHYDALSSAGLRGFNTRSQLQDQLDEALNTERVMSQQPWNKNIEAFCFPANGYIIFFGQIKPRNNEGR
jgi:hypothetical protein